MRKQVISQDKLGARSSELGASRSNGAEISEVFSSIQGEGPYLGVKQIFVRFGRCNMHCHYCDELEKMKEERFTVVSQDELVKSVTQMEREKGPHHSVSLTGGEPLFYAPFLKGFMSTLKSKGVTTYLETNGTLPRELEQVIALTDVVAMDLKPASSTLDRDFTQMHREFLKIALQTEVFTKVVITPATKKEEVMACVDLVAATNAKIPFIFQPLSDPIGINAESLRLIEKDFFAMAQERLHDVRVIPQMHKIWGVR